MAGAGGKNMVINSNSNRILNIDLSIVIVSWNVCQLLNQCLESIYEQTNGLTVEIIVVDNNSQDETKHMLSTKFPDVRVIINEQNLGFATANNQGLKLSQGKYVALLNPDTIILNDALSKMVAYLERQAEVGVVGAKLLLPNGETQGGTAGFYPGFMTMLNYTLFLSFLFPNRFRAIWLSRLAMKESPVEVGWVSGACMIVRRRILSEVGLLNAGFFMYVEDIEWCARIGQQGWRIIFLGDTKITHYAKASSYQQESGFISKNLINGFNYLYSEQYGRLPIILLHLLGVISFSSRAAMYHLAATMHMSIDKNNKMALTMWDCAIYSFSFFRRYAKTGRIVKNNLMCNFTDDKII